MGATHVTATVRNIADPVQQRLKKLPAVRLKVSTRRGDLESSLHLPR